MIDVPHERDNGRARLELFFFRRLRWRWSDHDLFFLVNATTFFAPLFFQDESVPLRDPRGHVGFDRLIGINENVEVIHQLLDELKIFQAELRCQLLDDDWGLDGDDILELLFNRRCCGFCG